MSCDSYVETLQNSVVIAKEFPLISNLNMIENIAIIEEFHSKLTTNDAHKNVLDLLKKINYTHIAYKNIQDCDSMEIFCAMLLRAIFSEGDIVVICYIYSLVEDLETLQEIIDMFEKLEMQKDIIFIDSKKNEYLSANIKLLEESKNGL